MVVKIPSPQIETLNRRNLIIFSQKSKPPGYAAGGL
jgi:hypothetical protein